MKLVFFGTPSFVVPVLATLIKKYDVIAVVTAPDKKVGRKQLLTPSPVKQFATQNNTPVINLEEMENEKWTTENPTPDLFIVAAYGKIIPQTILDIPTLGAINIHPSLLPIYRGPSPLSEAIKNGDKTTGISFMLMDEQMDHGPILHQITYPLDHSETFATLADDIFKQSAELLPQVIDDYSAGKITPLSQDENKKTYTKMLTKKNGYIDLSALNNLNSLEIERMIRAYYPWPTVWGELKTKNGQLKTIKFLPASACHPERPKGVEGSLEIPKQVRNDESFCIQMEGKNPVTIKDFLNGYPETKALLEKII